MPKRAKPISSFLGKIFDDSNLGLLTLQSTNSQTRVAGYQLMDLRTGEPYPGRVTNTTLVKGFEESCIGTMPVAGQTAVLDNTYYNIARVDHPLGRPAEIHLSFDATGEPQAITIEDWLRNAYTMLEPQSESSDATSDDEPHDGMMHGSVYDSTISDAGSLAMLHSFLDGADADVRNQVARYCARRTLDIAPLSDIMRSARASQYRKPAEVRHRPRRQPHDAPQATSHHGRLVDGRRPRPLA